MYLHTTFEHNDNGFNTAVESTGCLHYQAARIIIIIIAYYLRTRTAQYIIIIILCCISAISYILNFSRCCKMSEPLVRYEAKMCHFRYSSLGKKKRKTLYLTSYTDFNVVKYNKQVYFILFFIITKLQLIIGSYPK